LEEFISNVNEDSFQLLKRFALSGISCRVLAPTRYQNPYCYGCCFQSERGCILSTNTAETVLGSIQALAFILSEEEDGRT